MERSEASSHKRESPSPHEQENDRGSNVPSSAGHPARAAKAHGPYAVRMFVRYYLEVPRPFEEVEAALLASPEMWVPRLARAADDRAEVLMAELGIGPQDGPLRKRAEISIGQPVQSATRTLLPMSWEATGPRALFPQFDADLEVAPLGPGLTQLSISARYRPPLGALGRVIDRVLLHRVAEAAVKNFLDRVGERVRAEALAAK